MIILPILTALLMHSSLKTLENVVFELGSERIPISSKIRPQSVHNRSLCHSWNEKQLSSFHCGLLFFFRFKKTNGATSFGRGMQHVTSGKCVQSARGGSPHKGDFVGLRTGCATGWEALRRVFTFPNPGETHNPFMSKFKKYILSTFLKGTYKWVGKNW